MTPAPEIKSPILRRQLDRWYPLKDHDVQMALCRAVGDGVRFPVVPAGRRSGKTERAKRFVVKEAHRVQGLYFCAAPTRAQAKSIWWADIKDLTLSAAHGRKPSETELTVFIPNGSEIRVVGMDEPARFEGIGWSGGIIDEIANIKPTAWYENILPALNTVDPRRPDYRAWAWLIGVPEGLNHYYEIYQQAKSGANPEYKVFHWKSAEILPPDVIEAAKRMMSARQFKQEYEASFETAGGRVYEDYGDDNVTDATIEPHEQLLWMHDQNYTPLSSAIGVRRGANNDDLYLLDEIILTSAVSRQSALEFVERYKDHKNKNVLIYGDPAGKHGEKHGHASDYTEIESVLSASGWTFERRVKPSTLSIKDGQNAVRAKVKSASGAVSLFVNPAKAKMVHKGFLTVQLKDGSTFLEADSDGQHVLSAIRYCCEYEFGLNRQTTVRLR